MPLPDALRRHSSLGPSRYLLVGVLWLFVGAGVLPALIFLSGIALLGRYPGASLGSTYSSIFAGLEAASPASWGVVVGPYVLYLLFKAVIAWWRTSARWA